MAIPVPAVETRQLMKRPLSNVDAMFYLALSIMMIGAVVGGIVR